MIIKICWKKKEKKTKLCLKKSKIAKEKLNYKILISKVVKIKSISLKFYLKV